LQKHITHLNFAKGFRGGERQTQLLITQLAQKGYKQQLIVRKNSQLIKRCQEIPHLHIIEITKPYILHLNLIKDSTILHAHETKALQFAYFAHLFFKKDYIVTRRVDNTIKPNFFNTQLYTQARHCVALSSAIQKTIEAVAPQANITIIPSAYNAIPIDKEKVNAIKQRFQGKFLIGHVGALDEKHKGQSHIITLAKKLEKKYPNIHFLLVGDGKDADMLKEMAHGLHNITFEGFVTNVNDYIAALDLFLFPSHNEGLGSTLLDAMFCGVAIVASDVGGIPDIIKHNQNGLLFPSGDDEQLYKAVMELYENEAKRDALAQQGKKEIQKYAPETMTQSYISLYKL